MFYIFVLYSLRDNKTYTGYTSNLEKRLIEHNSSRVNATKHRIPLNLLFSESFISKTEAKKRELWWKSGSGRKKLKEYFNTFIVKEKFGRI